VTAADARRPRHRAAIEFNNIVTARVKNSLGDKAGRRWRPHRTAIIVTLTKTRMGVNSAIFEARYAPIRIPAYRSLRSVGTSVQICRSPKVSPKKKPANESQYAT